VSKKKFPEDLHALGSEILDSLPFRIFVDSVKVATEMW